MNLTRHNYEEYFMLYVDNELKAEERAQVQQFIRENPDLGEELAILQKAVLDPEEVISFADKASLYREETVSKTSVIPLWRRRIPAAAAILLLVSGTIWLWKSNGRPDAPTQSSHTIAGRLPATEATQPATGNAGAGDTAPSASSQNLPQPASQQPSQPVDPQHPATGNSTAVIGKSQDPSVANSGKDRGGAGTASGISGTQGTPEVPGTQGASGGQGAPGTQGASARTPGAPGTLPDGTTGLTNTDPGNGSQPSTTQPNNSTNIPSTIPLNGPLTPSTQIASATVPKKNPGNVTTEHSASYHTLEDADQTNDDNKILFVRADQVMNSGVKGFFRKASRVIKRSASLSSDNIHAEPDADR